MYTGKFQTRCPPSVSTNSEIPHIEMRTPSTTGETETNNISIRNYVRLDWLNTSEKWMLTDSKLKKTKEIHHRYHRWNLEVYWLLLEVRERLKTVVLIRIVTTNDCKRYKSKRLPMNERLRILKTENPSNLVPKVWHVRLKPYGTYRVRPHYPLLLWMTKRMSGVTRQERLCVCVCVFVS